MTTNATPPAWAELALRAFVSARDFESVSGDLLEDYRDDIYETRGHLRANVWYVRQVTGYAWRHAGVWVILLAVGFLSRTAMDWHMPTTDFQTRSAVSTLIAVAIFLASGFWAGWRSGSYAAGAVIALAIATLALPIQLVGAALLLAGSHGPSVLTAIRSSGGVAEAFTMPLMTVIPGVVLGAIGGVFGTKTRRFTARVDVISQ